jgi:hypothetical protein
MVLARQRVLGLGGRYMEREREIYIYISTYKDAY